MTKVTISQMQHLNELENRLSKKETVSQNMDFVEEGSPLDLEIKKMKSIHGEDLDGLPPGHPLFRILAEAKQRYDIMKAAQKAQADMRENVGGKTPNKTPKGVSINAKVKPEETESARVIAAHKVNKAIEQTDDSLRRLMKEIIDNEALINTEHVGKLRLYRLKRMADAMRRLLGESKIPGARA